MMTSTSMVSDVMLAVIKGELPLSSLEEVGVHLTCEGGSCTITSDTPIVVNPSASDIAQGILRYKANSDDLRRWAFFIIAALEMVDFEGLDSHPSGDLLKGALWDASFHGEVTEDALRLSESLV